MKLWKRFSIYALLLISLLLLKNPIVSQFRLYSTSSEGGGWNLDTDGRFEFEWPLTSGVIGYTTDDGYNLFNYSAWNLYRENNSEFHDSWRASLYSFRENDNLLEPDNFTGYGWSVDERYLLVGFQFGRINNIYMYDLSKDYYEVIPETIRSFGLVNTFDVGFINETDTIITGNNEGKINAWPSLYIPYPPESNRTHQYQDQLNSSITKLSISPSTNYIVYQATKNGQTSVNIITNKFQFIQNLPFNGEIDEYKWTIQGNEENYYFSTYNDSTYSINNIHITSSGTNSLVQDSILYFTNLADYPSGKISFDMSTDGSKFGLLRNYELFILDTMQIQNNDIDELIFSKNYVFYYSDELTRITDFAIDETGENVVFNTELDVYDTSYENFTRVDSTIKIINIENSEIISELILRYLNVDVDYLRLELYLLGFSGIFGPVIVAVEGYYWYRRKQAKLQGIGTTANDPEFNGLYPPDK